VATKRGCELPAGTFFLMKGSVADFSAMPDHILLQAAVARRSAVTYQMPHIDLTNQWALAAFEVRHLSVAGG